MVLSVVWLVLGLVLLVFAADYLVKGAASIAAVIGISPLIVGLTVVSFGTSAPELAVSVASAFKGQADLAVGNVIGSNIFNVLVVLGLSAVIIPLVVHRQLIRFDVPVMVFLSGLLYALSFDGLISRTDGLILFALALVYVGILIRKAKRDKNPAVLKELESEFGIKEGREVSPEWLKNLFLIGVGMGGLVLGSQLLVTGAVDIARYFGVSELIIGLTIVSVGTSLPEVATSVVAAFKGEKDIAVGNVVGSNIFNIVLVLGLSSVVAPAGIAVSQQALDFDMLVMLAVALVTIPVFWYGFSVGRIGGAFFLLFYGAFLSYLLLGAMESAAYPAYLSVMLSYVAPAVGLILLGVLVAAIRQSKNSA